MAKLSLDLINLITHPSLKDIPLVREISIIYLNNVPRDAVTEPQNTQSSVLGKLKALQLRERTTSRQEIR